MNRELLWQVLERYGVRGRLREAAKSLYLQSEVWVRLQGFRKNSEWFGLARGVRQGLLPTTSLPRAVSPH